MADYWNKVRDWWKSEDVVVDDRSRARSSNKPTNPGKRAAAAKTVSRAAANAAKSVEQPITSGLSASWDWVKQRAVRAAQDAATQSAAAAADAAKQARIAAAKASAEAANAAS